MGLYGVMRTGVSGMNAQSNKLSAVADNIANVNTTGYKRASTEFTALILRSGSGTYNSGGVDTNVRYAISEGGPSQYTTSETDLAIQGNGFFLVSSDLAGTHQYLTRAGSFLKDDQGNLVNAAGYYLLGEAVGGGLQVVNVTPTAMQAAASTHANANANLDPSATVVTTPDGTATTAPTNYTSKSSITTYDYIGRKVVVDVYMTKTTAANGWLIQAYDGNTQLASNNFTFDTTATGKGRLAGPPTSLTMAIPGGAAAFNLDLSNITQVAAGFSFTATADGNAAGSVDSVEIDKNGNLFEIYDNGARVQTYTIKLADVPSPDRLTPEAGNVYSANAESGDWQTNVAGGSGLGTIASKTLEQSNVDLGTELTNMIESQRGYTANSKVFQTGADLLDVLVNLKR
jgi:flagellar hook protein FlgE